MARKKSPTLTEAELRLMNILWEKSPLTVGELVEELPRRTPLAYSTVLTTMRILEEKGYVRHGKEGRAFVYRPVVGRREAGESAVEYLVRQFFRGSAELLVLNVLENERIDPGELARLRRKIEEAH